MGRKLFFNNLKFTKIAMLQFAIPPHNIHENMKYLKNLKCTQKEEEEKHEKKVVTYRHDFCITSARLYPLILQNDSLQYTIGKSTI